jgi:hypothetical protein
VGPHSTAAARADAAVLHLILAHRHPIKRNITMDQGAGARCHDGGGAII